MAKHVKVSEGESLEKTRLDVGGEHASLVAYALIEARCNGAAASTYFETEPPILIVEVFC
jgi:hypothetical protein